MGGQYSSQQRDDAKSGHIRTSGMASCPISREVLEGVDKIELI